MKNFFKNLLTEVTRKKQENPVPNADDPTNSLAHSAIKNGEDSERERFAAHSSLIKDRFSHHTERRYMVVSDQAELDTAFNRFKGGLFKTMGVEFTPRGVTPVAGLRIEVGQLPGNKPYIYFDPWERTGWLVEQTTSGFSIAPADKIVERNTFMRGALWDVVTVYRPEEQIGLYRLSSVRSGERLLSLSLYQDYLLKELGLRTLHS